MNTVLPTIEEELTRKSLDELQRLIGLRESGVMTNAEYKRCVDTLFNICSGLVDGEFFELITQAGDEVEDDQSFVRSVRLSKGESIAIVNWHNEFEYVDVNMVRGVSSKAIASDNVVVSARKIIDKLKKAGFVEN